MLAVGHIALTPSGLQFEIKGNVPFNRGVTISLQEEGNQIKVFVRQDKTSKYNFGNYRPGYATVKVPRAKFYFITRNWGRVGFRGVWEISQGDYLLTFFLNISELPPVKGVNNPQRISTSEKAVAITARDRLNRFVEKDYIELQVVDGQLVIDFKTKS